MTNPHPITPPPELVEQWRNQAPTARDAGATRERWIAIQAARWGADQELNECCHLLRLQGFDVVDDLRAARRPKPPSLKEQALAELEILSDYAHGLGCSESAIRRALEALPND
jgi:hypothetical protein